MLVSLSEAECEIWSVFITHPSLDLRPALIGQWLHLYDIVYEYYIILIDFSILQRSVCPDLEIILSKLKGTVETLKRDFRYVSISSSQSYGSRSSSLHAKC